MHVRKLVAHVLVVAASLAICAYALDGVRVRSLSVLAVAACVLGVVNAIVRPILSLLALPLTIVTLGLFYLVVNGAAFGFAAFLVPGFSVASWVDAVLGALIVSVASTVIGWVLGIDDEDGKRKRKKRD